MKNNKIEIKNVSKIYKNSNNKALDNISFEINSSELVGFVGPNGSGKSTTINSILNTIKYDGEILINNIDCSKNYNDIKDLIGFVPDNIESFNHLSANDLLNLFSSIHKVNPEEFNNNLKVLLKGFQFSEDQMNEPISTLSKGNKQKISIICALIYNPKILILDEPLNGIDPISGNTLKKYMKKITENNGIVFFSSHILDVVESICTRVIFINNGKIINDLKIEELNKLAHDSNKKLEDLFLELLKND